MGQVHSRGAGQLQDPRQPTHAAGISVGRQSHRLHLPAAVLPGSQPHRAACGKTCTTTSLVITRCQGMQQLMTEVYAYLRCRNHHGRHEYLRTRAA